MALTLGPPTWGSNTWGTDAWGDGTWDVTVSAGSDPTTGYAAWQSVVVHAWGWVFLLCVLAPQMTGAFDGHS